MEPDQKTNTNPAASGKRRFARVSLDAQVQVSVENSDQLFTSRVKDLSVGGVFIRTKSTRPIGTGIRLRLHVEKDGIVVETRGIIVREISVEEAEADDRLVAGLGVMFVDVDAQTLECLKTLVGKGTDY